MAKQKMANKTSGCLLVGYDFSNEGNGVVIVGVQENGVNNVYNAFSGDAAKEIFEKLLGPKLIDFD